MSKAIGEIISVPKTIRTRNVLSSEVDKYFHGDSTLTHIVIVDEQYKPFGLLTRSAYYIRTGGAYGFQLYHKKHADVLASRWGVGVMGRWGQVYYLTQVLHFVIVS